MGINIGTAGFRPTELNYSGDWGRKELNWGETDFGE
jgi:hypothetical protein